MSCCMVLCMLLFCEVGIPQTSNSPPLKNSGVSLGVGLGSKKGSQSGSLSPYWRCICPFFAPRGRGPDATCCTSARHTDAYTYWNIRSSKTK